MTIRGPADERQVMTDSLPSWRHYRANWARQPPRPAVPEHMSYVYIWMNHCTRVANVSELCDRDLPPLRRYCRRDRARQLPRPLVCVTHKWVTSHVRLSHVTRVNESCGMYEWVEWVEWHVWINKSLVNPQSTSHQSNKPCTVLQYPSRKVCINELNR